MKCEDFAAAGLDNERLGGAEWIAAREHASICPRCGALQESWQSARAELRLVYEDTDAVETPARVEMRVLQAFRLQHQKRTQRAVAMIAAWTLAAAAVVIGAVGWREWHASSQREALRNQTLGTGETRAANAPGAFAQEGIAGEKNAEDILSSDAGENGFTMLPGSLATASDDAAIVEVRMPRAALGALGFPVDEERAGELIQVDLLVGNDGLPEAVRLRE